MIFTIDTSEIDEKIQDNVDDFLFKVSNRLVNEMKQEAPVHEGRLRQSIQILGQEDGKYFVGTNVDYAVPLHEGTDPFYPPIEPLKNWARLKLGAENLAYAVQEKIAEEGVEPNPFVDRAIKNLNQRF